MKKCILTLALSAVDGVSKVSLRAALAVLALGGVLAGLVACRRLFTALAVPVALTRCNGGEGEVELLFIHFESYFT